MTDDEWASFDAREREFAVRWLRFSEPERDDFCRQLLTAIEVLQRLRVFDADGDESPAGLGGS